MNNEDGFRIHRHEPVQPPHKWTGDETQVIPVTSATPLGASGPVKSPRPIKDKPPRPASNGHDVAIAVIICVALVAIALICTVGVVKIA